MCARAEENKSLLQQYKTPVLLLGGVAAGSLIGAAAPDFGQKPSPIGGSFLNLLFTIAAPLVFVSIACAVGSMVNMRRLASTVVKSPQRPGFRDAARPERRTHTAMPPCR